MSTSSDQRQVHSIKAAALALLSQREHSRQELLDKLSRKFSDGAEIEKQLDTLAKNNLQSEERFVQGFVRMRQSMGKGPKLIKRELTLRGISQYLIESYVAEQDDCWLALGRKVYDKKFGGTTTTDVRERARRIRFMVSRGFTPETVFYLMELDENAPPPLDWVAYSLFPAHSAFRGAIKVNATEERSRWLCVIEKKLWVFFSSSFLHQVLPLFFGWARIPLLESLNQ